MKSGLKNYQKENMSFTTSIPEHLIFLLIIQQFLCTYSTAQWNVPLTTKLAVWLGIFFLVCEWGMVGSLFSLLPPLLLPPPPCFGSWILNFCCPRGNATTQKFFQTHTLPATKGSFLHAGTTTTFISLFCKRGKAPPQSYFSYSCIHVLNTNGPSCIFIPFFLSLPRPCNTCVVFR